MADYPLVTYVTDGIESAMAQAKAAAGYRYVLVHGAYTAQRALEAGVLDELQIHQIPVLFGAGRRQFEVLQARVELEIVRVIDTPEVSALARTASLPFRTRSAQREDGGELRRRLGVGQRHGAEHDLAGGAVEGDDVALGHGDGAGGEVVAGDLHRVGAHDGRDAPAPGDHRGVAHEPAACGEDPLGHLHAVHVLRRGLVADEHHRLAPLGRVDGIVGGEVHAAHGRAGRGAQALGDHLLVAALELRVEHLVEVVGLDALEGLGLA